MIRPPLDEARGLCQGNTIIPISLELYSDIKTPIEVLRILKEKSELCYLLESVEGGKKWGRYSFLGYDPKNILICKNGIFTINDCKKFIGSKAIQTNDPNFELRKIMTEYKSPKLDIMPPFTGGLVGYISYDYIKYTEKSLKLVNSNDYNFDDLNLMLFDKVIVFDHLRQKIILIVNVSVKDFENSYIKGVIALKEIEGIIKSIASPKKYTSRLLSEFKPMFSKDEYCEKVLKIKDHIHEGDIFQAVLSNRSEAEFEGDLLSVYRALRTINPSPYMFYMSFGDTQIAGASPETLVSLKNNTLSTFPIAGTCPRGKTKQEDDMLIDELLKNEKELAEHNMLVDLSRNDIGKISDFGTVNVLDYQQILKFSHVSHIASTVTGNLKSGLDQFDALSAVLPAGTLSGAPKIRACEIINGLEGCKRGIYGGGIGYIDFSGNMDLCIAIRMTVKKDNKIFVQAGAGIVYDSVPENEYAECINKGRAMISAIELSAEVEE